MVPISRMVSLLSEKRLCANVTGSTKAARDTTRSSSRIQNIHATSRLSVFCRAEGRQDCRHDSCTLHAQRQQRSLHAKAPSFALPFAQALMPALQSAVASPMQRTCHLRGSNASRPQYTKIMPSEM